MSYKVPGLLSITLVFIALGIMDYQLFSISLAIGLIYALCIPVAFAFTLFNYCRKCPHVTQKSCRHVILGLIVARLFKPLAPSKYTLKEIFTALIPLMLLVIFPQYQLFLNISLFIAFWILMLIAVIIVRMEVCKKCENINCTFCPGKNNCRV